MMLAAIYGCIDIVEMLLTRGIDIHVMDEVGQTRTAITDDQIVTDSCVLVSHRV